MRIPREKLVVVALAGSLPSCVIYRTYEREVRVWDAQSGEPARHGEFRYGHATPVPHFPRNPDPVETALDGRGRAVTKIPGALGWIGYGEDSALIAGSQIRDGGTFQLYTLPSRAGHHLPSKWKVSISKPTE